MSRPDVIVNPLSLIAPGIFREIFQMTPDDPRVIPRDRPAPKGNAARASSAPASTIPGDAVSTAGTRGRGQLVGRHQPARCAKEIAACVRQVRRKPSTSLSAQASIFSIGSPCMWRTVILVMMPCT